MTQFNDYHGKPLKAGQKVHIAHTFGASNAGAKATIKELDKQESGAFALLDYDDGDKEVTQPNHVFIPVFMLVGA